MKVGRKTSEEEHGGSGGAGKSPNDRRLSAGRF
jgi:hypothetical protein